MVARVVTIGAPEPLEFENKFLDSITNVKIGNKARTRADGTRAVINEGTDGGDFVLNSGQGLKGDGTQYIDTGLIPDPTKDFTILFKQRFNNSLSSQQHGILGDPNSGRLHLGIDGQNGLRCAIGNHAVTKPETLTAGTIYSFIARYTASTKTLEMWNYNTGTKFTATSTVEPNIVDSFCILAVCEATGNHTAHVLDIVKDFYYIPRLLTDLEIEAHHQNPEYTIYLQNGIVKSAFLEQSILDEMNSGNGFAYPMCENNNAGDITHNLCNMSPVYGLRASGFTEVSENEFEIDIPAGVLWNDKIMEILPFDKNKYELTINIIRIDSGILGFYSGSGSWVTIVNPALNLTEGTRKYNVNVLDFKGVILADTSGFKGRIRIEKITRKAKIINYANSEMRLNADYLPTGIQTALLEQDSDGRIIGLAKEGILNFNASGYIAPNIVLSGDYCIDFYINTRELQSQHTRCINLEESENGEFGVYYDANGGALKAIIKVNNVVNSYVVFGTSLEVKAIISIELSGSDLSFYKNGTLIRTIAYDTTGTTTIKMIGSGYGQSGSLEDSSMGGVGIMNLKRTDEERAEAVNRLKYKFKVWS